MNFNLSDAIEVLTDMANEPDNIIEAINKPKILSDINAAKLILAGKGFLVSEEERKSLLEFVGELNSNANSHKPVVEKPDINDGDIMHKVQNPLIHRIPRGHSDIKNDLVRAIKSTIAEYRKAGFHVVTGIDIKIINHYNGSDIDDSTLSDIQIHLIRTGAN